MQTVASAQPWRRECKHRGRMRYGVRRRETERKESKTRDDFCAKDTHVGHQQTLSCGAYMHNVCASSKVRLLSPAYRRDRYETRSPFWDMHTRLTCLVTAHTTKTESSLPLLLSLSPLSFPPSLFVSLRSTAESRVGDQARDGGQNGELASRVTRRTRNKGVVARPDSSRIRNTARPLLLHRDLWHARLDQPRRR